MDPREMDREALEAFIAMSGPVRLWALANNPWVLVRALARPADFPEPLRLWLLRVGFFLRLDPVPTPAAALSAGDAPTYRAGADLDEPFPDPRPWYRRVFGKRA